MHVDVHLQCLFFLHTFKCPDTRDLNNLSNTSSIPMPPNSAMIFDCKSCLSTNAALHRVSKHEGMYVVP